MSQAQHQHNQINYPLEKKKKKRWSFEMETVDISTGSVTQVTGYVEANSHEK